MSPSAEVKQKKERIKEFKGSQMRSIFFPFTYTVGNYQELEALCDFLEVITGEEIEITEDEELVDGRFRGTFDI